MSVSSPLAHKTEPRTEGECTDNHREHQAPVPVHRCRLVLGTQPKNSVEGHK
jgi:hypothetical protein